MVTNQFMYGSCRKRTLLEEMTKMTKNHKKMMEWVMRIAQSFNGDAFTSYCITARWSDHAPARYLPNTLAVSAILKRLESSAKSEKARAE